MRNNQMFRWTDKTERSLFEIVSEDGVLHSREILHITRKICGILNDKSADSKAAHSFFIHPDNVIVSVGGDVRLEDKHLPLSFTEKYIAPELLRDTQTGAKARIYALGMLMLYMATGQEKKPVGEAEIGDRSLLAIIERCTAFDPMLRFSDLKALQDAISSGVWNRKENFSLLLKSAGVMILSALLLLSWREGKARGEKAGTDAGYGSGYTSGYKQGFNDAPGINIKGAKADPGSGNLSGNLASDVGAFTAFSEDSVFFSLEDSIFKMDEFTGKTELLSSDTGVYCLQYYDGWLYYCTAEKIFRIDPVKAKKEPFCDSRGGLFYIFDNTFYLYDSKDTGYLYRINQGNRTLTQLNGSMKYNCLNIVDGKLYYIDAERGSCICRSDPDGGNMSIISSSSYDSFCIYKGKIYVGTENGLTRMDLNGGNPERLTMLPAYSPNVSDGGIFYLAGRGRLPEWMSADGKTRYTIASSGAGSFNVAGQWIFYRNDSDGGRMWRVRISGADNAALSAK